MPEPTTAPSPAAAPPQDASRSEVIAYAMGNVQTATANQVLGVINQLLIVAMGISPLLTGFVISLKTIWDGVTDPVMAYITDNTRSRWGRRRPYILGGGIVLAVFLVCAVFFFPRTSTLKTNAQLEAYKEAVAGAAINALTRIDSPRALAAAGATTNAAGATVKNAPKKGLGPVASIRQGWRALEDPANAGQRTVILYMLGMALIFTTLTTIISVPYYALGIELSPSYNGRTQVVTYRALIEKFVALIMPWIPVICYSVYFVTAFDGLRWVALVVTLVTLPCTIIMVVCTRERTQISTQRKGKLPLGFWRSIWYTMKNVHFLKIFALYQFIGFSNGLFAQIGTYLNIYYVMGNAQSGAKLGAAIGMLATVLGFVLLPVLNWACRRFEKHVTLRVAIIWMSIGCVLKWWCLNPRHPWLQFILPFFFSIGIGSVYLVLSTMMADVTDVDELNTGRRREGMFGAVMAFLGKLIGSLTPVLAGAILVIAGLDPKAAVQTPQTILNLRLMYSFVPGTMLLLALLLLWRYPLTARRMTEIKAELQRRHIEAAAAETTAQTATSPA